MNTLKAEKRNLNVKAKRLRREGFVTGNLFGKEITNSIPLKMEKAEIERLLKTSNKGSQILLRIDDKLYNVLIKDIAFNSMANRVDEIDFQALVSNEEVHSVAEIIFLNREKLIAGVFQEQLTEISYRALPDNLVDKVKVDVGNMKVGEVLRVRDLDIAGNQSLTLLTPLDDIVASVTVVHNIVPETEAESDSTITE